MTPAPLVRYPLAEWILARSRRGGPFARGWLGQPYAYLVGPAANEFVFAHDDHFSQHEAMKALIPVDGPTSVVVSDPPEHARRRALVRPGLHHKQVVGYVDIMARTAAEALDSVVAEEAFDAYALFRAAIRRSTMRCLFGERVAAHADDVGDALQPLIELAGLMPQLIGVHERLNTPRWRRAMAARATLDRFVLGEIDRLATQPEQQESQVLSVLVHGRDGTGSGLTRAEVRDQVVTLIAAGYETTSAAMGWALYGLGGRPDALALARDEVRSVVGDGPVTAEHLTHLRWVNATISEALRLYPPASISARWVKRELTFAGHRIAPGTMIVYSPYATHRSPEVFADPGVFRPERWLEDRKPGPGEYVPFGGGAHRCLGSTMATTELVVMLATLLARGGYRLEPQRVRATGMTSMRPRDGVRIRLTDVVPHSWPGDSAAG
ncbi:cytochrome P450 [Granulicoccus sp. GXG6511]|uniref:cytochrome P450 n=1 Tax=Granulicoccus sp. GXG6511 TaxID=3381351 RepID=UPI003D7F0D0D